MTVRRRYAVALVVMLLLAAAAVAYGHWNPRRYVALMPLGTADAGWGLVVGGIIVGGAAVVLASRRHHPGRPVGAGIVALALPLGCLWGMRAELSAGFGEHRTSTTVARSADGRFEIRRVVIVWGDDSDGYAEEFWLRSLAGWRSRESPRPVVAVGHGGPGPDLRVAVAFTGARGIEVRTDHGEAYPAAFDPWQVATDRELHNCGDTDPLWLCQ